MVATTSSTNNISGRTPHSTVRQCIPQLPLSMELGPGIFLPCLTSESIEFRKYRADGTTYRVLSDGFNQRGRKRTAFEDGRLSGTASLAWGRKTRDAVPEQGEALANWSSSPPTTMQQFQIALGCPVMTRLWRLCSPSARDRRGRIDSTNTLVSSHMNGVGDGRPGRGKNSALTSEINKVEGIPADGRRRRRRKRSDGERICG